MNEINLKPPYCSSGQADAILDIFRRITPKMIDSKFVIDNNIATPPNAYKIVEFLKWLQIVGSDGNVNEEIASKLKLIGEEKERFITKLIKESYQNLLESVNLQEAKKDDLINYFVHNYRYGSAQALYAARLFVHLCQKYNIELSNNLKKKSPSISYKSKSQNKQNLNVLKKKGRESDNSQHEKTSDGMILKIYGKGVNLEFPPVNTKKELDKLIKVKLPSVLGALSIFLEEDTTAIKSDEKNEANDGKGVKDR